MTASGETGERHFKNYIHDFLPGVPKREMGSHQLEKAFRDHPAGTKIKILDHSKDNGKHHVKARVEKTGEEVRIPVSRISKPKREYKDEHAFKDVWNHFVANQSQNFDLEHMKKEIQRAKSDSSHPLSFEKANSEGFKGRIKKKSRRNSYFNELDRAIHTVHHVANHPDFYENVLNKDEARVTGSDRNELRPEWKEHHIGKQKNNTSKTDLVIGEKTPRIKKISYKKGGGSQLFSGEAGEFGAATMTVLNKMLDAREIDQGQHNAAKTHLQSLQHEMINRQDMSIASRHMNNLFSVHPKLQNKIFNEAVRGTNKFGEDSTSSVSHVITSHNFENNHTKIKRLDSPDSDLEDMIRRPFYVAKGTRPGRPLTVRANGK